MRTETAADADELDDPPLDSADLALDVDTIELVKGKAGKLGRGR